jgi:hypothetical protein
MFPNNESSDEVSPATPYGTFQDIAPDQKNQTQQLWMCTKAVRQSEALKNSLLIMT